MKLKKQESVKSVNSVFTAKTRLRNVGTGVIAIEDIAVKFFILTGRFKKHKKISKEIPLAEIETLGRVENELNIEWQGVTHRFVLESTELAETIHAKITKALDVQRKTFEAKEEVLKQKRNELVQTISDALKITELLFDVLRGLHGTVNWNQVKRNINCYKDFLDRFGAQNNRIHIDYEQLSSAIEKHLAVELSKEVYNSLQGLFEYFNGSTSEIEFPTQIHPNYHDAKQLIEAYYILNDIILGTVVGTEDVEAESLELLGALDDFSNSIGLAIDVAEVKDVINKLAAEKEKESVIQECRSVFMRQLSAIGIRY